jgi:acetate---CoA ligase (ADP-forming)
MSSLTPFFSPKRIAVVGASQGKSAFANHALTNLRNHGFPGQVTAINPRYEHIDGYPCLPSLSAMAEPPDLCVIAVRASLVPGLIAEAIKLGVPAATIVSSGFGERPDAESHALQAELDAVRADGRIRIIGPNGMGVAAFATRAVSIASANIPPQVPLGPVAIVAQSGGVAITLQLNSIWQGVGLSHLVTLGNECDVGLAEVIAHLAFDPDTSVIICYIEAIRAIEDLRRAIAACCENGKTIIVLKGGTTAAGQKAAASHTGAIAGNGAAWRGVAPTMGVVNSSSLEHAILTAHLFARYGKVKGNNLGAAATGGGLAVLLTDLLDELKLSAPPFTADTRRAIEQALPDVSANNPLDMGARFLSGDGSALARALKAIDTDPNVDNIVLLLNPMLDIRAVAFADAIRDGLSNVHKPVIVLSSDPRLDSRMHGGLRTAGFPVLYPANVGVAALNSWVLHRPPERHLVATRVHASEARRLAQREIEQRVAADENVILEFDAKRLLSAWDLSCPNEAIVAEEDEAVATATRIGFPVALKILSREMIHRGIGNGVLLSLKDEVELRDGYRRIARTAASLADAKILLQQMVHPGHEILVGAVQDRELGTLVIVGKGGADAESADGAIFSLLPVNPGTLNKALVDSTFAKDIHRHSDTIDIDALVGLAVKVGEFLQDNEQRVAELDLNPVIVGRTGSGATVVDALLILDNPKGRGVSRLRKSEPGISMPSLSSDVIR